jgi:hypothetical protein
MSQKVFNFRCGNCQGDQYYEDAQGSIICSYCGIQSQDYIAESHEAFEEGMVHGQSQGHSVRRHTLIGLKPKLMKRKFEPELLDYLSVYQYALQMICNSAFLVILGDTKSPQFAVLSQSLKEIWTKYLSAWKDANSSCELSFAFQRNHLKCNCKTEKFNHPLFPTKPLLLGFLYLVIRLHRLEFIIPDIIRWIERGLVPYLTLWDCLPESVKTTIPKSFRGPFKIQHNHAFGPVTPMNIWFHTCSLAESCGITPLPPLNGVLVGFTLIHSLGLAESVRTNFSKITQLFTIATPLDGADMTSTTLDNHYVEYIVGLVLLSCFMTNDWMEWNYLKHDQYHLITDGATNSSSPQKREKVSNKKTSSDDDSEEGSIEEETTEKNNEISNNSVFPALLPAIPMLSHEFQLNDSLPKVYLSTFLQQLQRTIPKEMKNHFSKAPSIHHNSDENNNNGNHLLDILHHTFSSSLSLDEKHSLQYFSNHFKSDQISLSEIYLLSSQYSFQNNLSKEDEKYLSSHHPSQLWRKKWNEINDVSSSGKRKRTSNNQKPATGDQEKDSKNNKNRPEQNQNIYLTSIRHHILHSTDHATSQPFLQYSYLIERCAKYLYCSPMLLHIILENYELQLIELIFYGRITAKMNENSLKNGKNLIHQEAKKEFEESNQKRYDKYYQNDTTKQERKELDKFAKYMKTAKIDFRLINRLIDLDYQKERRRRPKVSPIDEEKDEDWWGTKKTSHETVDQEEHEEDEEEVKGHEETIGEGAEMDNDIGNSVSNDSDEELPSRNKEYRDEEESEEDGEDEEVIDQVSEDEEQEENPSDDVTLRKLLTIHQLNSNRPSQPNSATFQELRASMMSTDEDEEFARLFPGQFYSR